MHRKMWSLYPTPDTYSALSITSVRIVTNAGEYKYQIGCQVDYNPQSPETPMLIMELERVVRNLPQTITGEAAKAMPTRTQVLVVNSLPGFTTTQLLSCIRRTSSTLASGELCSTTVEHDNAQC